MCEKCNQSSRMKNYFKFYIETVDELQIKKQSEQSNEGCSRKKKRNHTLHTRSRLVWIKRNFVNL